jgi:hypothetical protein
MKIARQTFAVLLTVTLLGIPQFAHANTPGGSIPNTWITDGVINAVASGPTMTYIGGTFNYVGPYTGGMVPVYASDGTPLTNFSKVSGLVYAAVSDGNGGAYVGGFEGFEGLAVDGVGRGCLFHILSTGSLDKSWDPQVTGDGLGAVKCMVLKGKILYIGGVITSVHGQARQNIAAIDVTTGLPTSWNPGADFSVNGMDAATNALYVGGEFKNIGGQARQYLAAIDYSTGLATGWTHVADFAVLDIKTDGVKVYAAGQFKKIDGFARQRLCAFDLSTGDLLPWNPNADDIVETILIDGSTIFVGGVFKNIGGTGRVALAALDATTGQALSLDAQIKPYPGSFEVSNVYALAVQNASLYVAGRFSQVGGVQRAGFACVAKDTGVPSSWSPMADSYGRAIAISDAKIFLGGTMDSVGGVMRSNIAALNGITGVANAWNPGADKGVSALAVSGFTLYVGGWFTNVAGTARNSLAAIDMVSGNALAWNPNPNDQVSAMVMNGSTLYVDGYFTNIGGSNRPGVAAVDSASGAVASWNPAIPGLNAPNFAALAVSNSAVYAGSKSGVYAIDAVTGALSWSKSGMNTSALAIDNGSLFVGGNFSITSPVVRNNLAALDLVSGSFTSWSADTDGVVTALMANASTLIVGGHYTQIAGQNRLDLAEVDATSGVPTAWDPQPDDEPLSFATNGKYLYMGGYFIQFQADNAFHTYFAQFDFPSTQGPQISQLKVSNITEIAADISWLTDQPATGRVEWGLTTSYGNSTFQLPDLITSHDTKLDGLAQGTLYHARVRSKNASGLESISGDLTFQTPSAVKNNTNEIINVVNPLKGVSAQISVSPTQSGTLDIWVYDRRGTQVHHHTIDVTSGTTLVIWNGKNDSGNVVAAGTYLMRIRGAGLDQKSRIVIVD